MSSFLTSFRVVCLSPCYAIVLVDWGGSSWRVSVSRFGSSTQQSSLRWLSRPGTQSRSKTVFFTVSPLTLELNCCFTATDTYCTKDYQGQGAQDGYLDLHTSPELWVHSFQPSGFIYIADKLKTQWIIVYLSARLQRSWAMSSYRWTKTKAKRNTHKCTADEQFRLANSK